MTLRLHPALACSALVLTALLLASCDKPGGHAAATYGGILTGLPYNGQNRDFQVAVYTLRDGEGRGAQLARGSQNIRGEYHLELQIADQPVLIEVSPPLADDPPDTTSPPTDPYRLTAVTNFRGGQVNRVNVTAWTSVAAGLAVYKIAIGIAAEQAIDEANAEVSALLGLDILGITPRRVISEKNLATSPGSDWQYGFYVAAFGSWAASEQRASYPAPPDSRLSADTLALQVYDDMLFDGLLNGQSADGTLYFGLEALSAERYRHLLALHMLKAAQDTRASAGVAAASLLPAAHRLNDSTSTIFGPLPLPLPLDDNGPVILGTRPADGDLVYGTFTATLSAFDAVGVGSVEFLLDDNLLDRITDSAEPSLAIDSRAWDDGPHTLSLRVTSVTGGNSEARLQLQVANTQTAIANIRPPADSHQRGFLHASVQVADPAGLKSVEFAINNSNIFTAEAPEKPSVLINTQYFDDGPHTLRVTATNNADTSFSQTLPFVIDNTVPQILDLTPPDASYHRSALSLGAIASDANLQTVQFLIDGLVSGQAADPRNATYRLNTVAYKDGKHTLSVAAVDQAGNRSTRTQSLYFDNTPPRLSNFLPADGTHFGAERFYVQALIEDTSPFTTEYFLDGMHHTAVKVYGPTLSAAVINGGFLVKGKHTVKIVATDKAGNIGEATLTLIRD